MHPKASFGCSTVFLLLATVAVCLICFVVELVLDTSFPRYAITIERFFLGPTFLVPISIGLFAGFRWGRTLPRLSSRLIFAVPSLIALWELVAIIRSSYYPQGLSRNLIDNYLLPAPYCSTSECLGELIITVPLFSSIAYALGAELGRIFKRSRHS